MGEPHSQFHKTHGFYVHGVPIETATLPAGWKSRVIPVKDENRARGKVGWCLEAHDLSASKLAEDYDLSAKNPAKQKDAEHLAPNDILKQIRTKEKLVSGLLDEIEDLLAEK